MIRSRKSTLISLVFLVNNILIFQGCANKEQIKKLNLETTKTTEEKISSSASLQELDKLCKTIPILDDFELHIKELISNNHNDHEFVIYKYSSNTDFTKVRNFYMDYFRQMNWRVNDGSSYGFGVGFQKDDFIVEIEEVGYKTIYAISCGKPSPFKK